MKKLRLRLTNLPKVVQLVSGATGFVPKSSKFSCFINWISQRTVRK